MDKNTHGLIRPLEMTNYTYFLLKTFFPPLFSLLFSATDSLPLHPFPFFSVYLLPNNQNPPLFVVVLFLFSFVTWSLFIYSLFFSSNQNPIVLFCWKMSIGNTSTQFSYETGFNGGSFNSFLKFYSLKERVSLCFHAIY